jgi:hypothetical protein
LVFSGESASADEAGAEKWSADILPQILSTYELRDVWNADETGLFYRQQPAKTLAFPNEKVSGAKISKDRISVLLAGNAEGERFPPCIIGTAANPHAFRKAGISNGNTLRSHGFHYYFNKTAWMTSVIWNDWLDKLNAEMIRQDRKIALLVDNCSSHPAGDRSNVTVFFLPPNTTSLLQPMDGGIIKAFKDHFRRKMNWNFIQNMVSFKSAPAYGKSIDVLQASTWAVQAFKSLSNSTFQNCFSHCGFCVPLIQEDPPTEKEALASVPVLNGVVFFDDDETDEIDLSS